MKPANDCLVLVVGYFTNPFRRSQNRIANKQDGCTGAFFEGRYKSIAILDEEALLSVCASLRGLAVVPRVGGARMLKLSGARLLGRFLSASRGRLREIAQRIGVRHLVNVG